MLQGLELLLQKKIDPAEPHKFEPRQHGSPDACKWCGAAYWDEIHDTKARKPPKKSDA